MTPEQTRVTEWMGANGFKWYVDYVAEGNEFGIWDHGSFDDPVTQEQATFFYRLDLKARRDALSSVKSEMLRETEATIRAKAFITPEGLDGYKTAMRDTSLIIKDRTAAIDQLLKETETQV